MHIRATILLCVAVAASPARADQPWRYVVPGPDDPFAHPPPRALALTDTPPPDLKESVTYRGARRRYGQWAYGTGRSALVVVVVDELGPNEADLYVDANRDREITAGDRVAGPGPAWRVAVPAVVPDGEAVKHLARTVAFRYGRVSRTLGVATCSYVEGRATLGGKAVAVRRVDGDGNGLFADAQDRVWADLNGDGKWDPAAEEFLFAPILRLGGRRVAVRADARGERLSFAELAGTGTVRLKLPANLRPEQVDDIQVTVQSRDGAVASVRGLDGKAVVPVGEYRVSALFLTLKDGHGGLPWGFIFTDNGGKDPAWHAVAADRETAIDPVGTPDFSAAIGDGPTAEPGELLTARPALYTGGGLLIERAYRGEYKGDRFDAGCNGRVTLVTDAGKVLDSAQSGFA